MENKKALKRIIKLSYQISCNDIHEYQAMEDLRDCAVYVMVSHGKRKKNQTK